MSFSHYAEYKDSGVEWLGDVPAHWVLVSLGRVSLSRCDGPFGSGIKSEHYTDEGALVVRLQNIRADGFVDGEPAFLDLQYFHNELRGHSVESGDVLIAGLGDERNTVGRACVAPIGIEPALVKADCFRFRIDPKRGVPHFVAAQLSAGAENDGGRLATGSTRSRIPLNAMASRKLALPLLEEQCAVVTFIDHETAKIDALVAEQEKLIALLKEKRQAVISHAVTKGLNPGVPMKDSGIEWLGDVPAHWRVMPIRLAARLESGHTPSRSHPEYWENCSVPWFTLGDVWQIRDGKTDHVVETKELVSEMGLANSSARVLPAGTVMLSRTASVGFTAIMGVDMATTQDFANWVCGPTLRSEFLLYALRGMHSEFQRLMMGSTHNTIYMPDIQAFRFALPPVGEQDAIVDELRLELKQIDGLTEEAEKGIVLLKERRSALISAAVTGKIDVRGRVAQREAACHP